MTQHRQYQISARGVPANAHLFVRVRLCHPSERFHTLSDSLWIHRHRTQRVAGTEDSHAVVRPVHPPRQHVEVRVHPRQHKAAAVVEDHDGACLGSVTDPEARDGGVGDGHDVDGALMFLCP